MARLAPRVSCLLALTISAPCAAASALVAAGTPEGFEQLAGSKVTLVDVYFGGRKIAETLAQTRPGLLQFRSPGDILAALPSVIRDPVLLSTLAGQLSSNDDVACGYSNANSCGILTPQVLGIVYDEEHFRVEIFVNPKFLATSKSVPDGLLPTPSAPLSLTSALGLAASGSLGEPGIYNVQNRTVLAFRNARIRTSNAFASKLGWVVDDLVGEVEHTTCVIQRVCFGGQEMTLSASGEISGLAWERNLIRRSTVKLCAGHRSSFSLRVRLASSSS